MKKLLVVSFVLLLLVLYTACETKTEKVLEVDAGTDASVATDVAAPKADVAVAPDAATKD